MILNEKLEKIVEKFIQENVAESDRKEFIIASIHFNINSNDCSKYDLMRINRKVKKIAYEAENEILAKASIYSYMLFREIQRSKIAKESIYNIELSLINIYSIITDYFTYRIDESELNIKLIDELSNVLIS